ncbi:hypothetical protein ACE5IS_02860 [Leptospira wolffii]|uniref:Uncharacterized protein n=1 Tax=Leptospira wolffii TaxID=409998 RepID=A0ABV5BKH5_9LEPT
MEELENSKPWPVRRLMRSPFPEILLILLYIFFSLLKAMGIRGNHREGWSFIFGAMFAEIGIYLIPPAILMIVKGLRTFPRFLILAVGFASISFICSVPILPKKEILVATLPVSGIQPTERFTATEFGKLKTNTLGAEFEGVIYVFTEMEYLSRPSGKMFLEDVASGVKSKGLETLGGEIVSEYPVDIGKLESVEVQQKVNEEFYMKTRVYIVADKIYSAAVMGSPKNLDKQEVRKFFESVHIEKRDTPKERDDD